MKGSITAIRSNFTAGAIVVALSCFTAILSGQSRAIHPITVERRLALVIGNANYGRSPLVNPIHDAESVATELRSLGFLVDVSTNVNLRQLTQAIDAFAGHLQTGDLALFYYSGHGIQATGENYLLPVDYQAATEADVPYVAYSANRLRDKMERSGARLRIIILDACRNNPFDASKGGPSGLAAMDSAAEGTMIAYATGDNRTASDNPGRQNGLFTEHLLSALREPGLDLHDIFKRVKQEVYYASNKLQNPFTYDDVAGTYYFRPPGTAVNTPAESRMVASDAGWELIKDSTNPADFDEFVKAFPESNLAATARSRAAELRRIVFNASANNGPARLPAAGPDAERPSIVPEPIYRRAIALSKDRNYEAAYPLLRQAAEAGHVEAMEKLAYALHHGQGVPQDFGEAMRWYRRAADLGNAEAMGEVGFLYHNGLGVPMDFDVAMRWYRKAADAGDPSSMNNIGFLYYRGVGVPQDFGAAMVWFEKAANLGVAAACGYMGLMFQQGQGVKVSVTRAVDWYKKGAALGDKSSIQRLNALGRR
jgi:hypothetical protein